MAATRQPGSGADEKLCPWRLREWSQVFLDATYLQLTFNPDTHIMNNKAISGFDHTTNMDMIQKGASGGRYYFCLRN